MGKKIIILLDDKRTRMGQIQREILRLVVGVLYVNQVPNHRETLPEGLQPLALVILEHPRGLISDQKRSNASKIKPRVTMQNYSS